MAIEMVAPATDTVLINTLTAGERRHLTALEKRIEHGLQTFKEVGAALMEVRDSRLYREAHPSFEAYCQSRWGLERQRAYQLIGAVEVVERLPEAHRALVRNEATARELVTVMRDDPDVLQEVWAGVVERAKADGGKVTAETVRLVKAELLPPPANHAVSLKGRILADAGRLRAIYLAWTETGPTGKDQREVKQALRAITSDA